MLRKRKLVLLFAWIFILLPVIHITYYWFLYTGINNGKENFFENLLLFSLSFNFNNIFFFLWLMEFIFFLTIGACLIIKEDYAPDLISILSVIFLATNIISLIIYKGDNIYLFLFSLPLLIFASMVFIYMILTSIRRCPFFLCKINLFKPYLRHRCYIDAEISDINTDFETNGKITNISSLGGYLLTNTFINIGEKYKISFILNGKNINYNIMVVRKIKKDKNYKNGFGYTIIEIDKKTKKFLTDFLKKNNSIQIYRRPRLGNMDLNIEIKTNEGILKNRVYDIDEKGAFIESNEKWNLEDKIDGNITSGKNSFSVHGKIIRLNDRENLSYPKGFAMIFENNSLKIKDILKKRISE